MRWFAPPIHSAGKEPQMTSKGGNPRDSEQTVARDQETSIPAGFRVGIITAITVVLGFSLLFLRSWVFEFPGEWTPSSAIAAILMLFAVVIQVVALWRSLQPKDELTIEYRRTLRWFLASVIVLLISLVTAAVSYS
jgi:hypothetical protein